VLLVDDRQTEPAEARVGLNERVGADRQHRLARRQTRRDPLSLACR